MKERIKQLYQDAGRLHHEAKALIDAHDGKEMSAEVSAQVDTLLDQVDVKTAEAKRLERADTQGNDLSAPVNQLGAGAADAAPKSEQADLRTKAFGKALRSGVRALNATEHKALQVDDDEAGGFLVAPVEFATGLIKFVDDQVHVRGMSTVHTLTSAKSLGIVTMDEDLSDATWTSELLTGDEDTVKPFGGRALNPHPLAKRIKVSRTLIRLAMMGAERIVQQRLGYKFGVAMETGFLTGNGANQPLGVFTASDQGIPTSRDTTASSTTDFTTDNLVDLLYSLKPQYQARATWMAHRDFIKALRKKKTGDGQYIWQPGLQGQPASILERPYVMSEFAPSTFTTGRYVAIVGDWSFYHIAEALTLQVQVLEELYAATNQVGYIGRMEADGMPVLAEAFARLKLA